MIETSGDFRRPRYSTGTVIRIEARCIVVSCRSVRGVPYVHNFGHREGVRVGGGQRAELINAEAAPVVTSGRHRQAVQIDAAYRAWARNRGDLDRLRELRTAIDGVLAESRVSSS